MRAFTIKASDIARCPKHSFSPAHYNDDGTCKCQKEATVKKTCERCGALKSKPGAGEFDMMDYCAVCSRNLCDACMETGCCGNVPALSGTEADNQDDDSEPRRTT